MRLAAVLMAIALGASPLGLAQTAKPSSENVPPLSYVCTMAGDEDVIEDKPGKCRKCGMDLHPIRLDSVWTCATRPLLIVESKPGRCPVDGTPLVQVTAAVSWTCKDDPSIEKLEPGACASGAPMIKRYAARAHGNHNPQHGGQFFMAPDSWHHIEGAYLANGVFRLYLYDDFTKPLPLAQVRGVTARIVTKQTYDAATRTTKELASAPLVRNGRVMEARIGKVPFPAQMTAKVSFKKGDAEHVFDFAFESYSKEPPAGARTTSTTPSAAPITTSAAAIATTTTTEGGTSTIEIAPSMDNALIPTPIPETVPEILAQLRTRTDQIRTFIDRGSFASVYVPAFQAKDLALALDAHKEAIAPDKRKIAQPAIAQLVRSAYLLDAFGDLGNKQQISDAFTVFEAAVKEIQASFPNR